MATSVASVVSHFPEAENGFTTTTAGSVGSGAGTVTLNSVAGYTNGLPVVLVIDPTDATKKQTFTGIVDTAGVQITSVVWTAGTNQTHALGATVVDYATATHIAMISKGISVGHEQTGVHKADLPLTTPKITTSINDANGNEVIKTPATASAVNEITVTNAATGNSPAISATGGDTDIDLSFLPKGTGDVLFKGYALRKGWFIVSDTWTYASATTITVPTDATLMYSVGDKLIIVNSGTKYFYIVGVSATTLTVTGGSDYTVANAAITTIYHSKAASPVGFLNGFNFTPTYTGFSVNPTISASKFTINGRLCTWSYSKSGNGTSNATGFTMTLPVTADSTSWRGAANDMVDNGVSLAAAGMVAPTSTTVITLYQNGAGLTWTAANAKSAAFTISYLI